MGVICIYATTNILIPLLKESCKGSSLMFVSMPVWSCVWWCCCGVMGLSQGFCLALSYVKLHLRPRLCLTLRSMLSRRPAPPRPICRVLLIVDHNAVTP